MIQSYKQNPNVAERYDVILIGSGMGSLTAAAILIVNILSNTFKN